jgi:predicted Zn-dependent protease
MTELLRLESVLKSMPKNAPDRPTVLRRLAEGYAELERLSERERARASAAAEAVERLQKQPAPPPPKRRGSGTLL